jgi:hypothetical protein
MTNENVSKFEKTQAQLEGLLEEIGVLAKKTPNDSVNKFKLKFINEILKSGNNVLGKDYRPLSSFEQFNEDEVPSNSDVTFILSQYLNCFEKLRADNICNESRYDGNKYVSEWFWRIDKDKSKVKTSAPKKIK